MNPELVSEERRKRMTKEWLTAGKGSNAGDLMSDVAVGALSLGEALGEAYYEGLADGLKALGVVWVINSSDGDIWGEKAQAHSLREGPVLVRMED